MYISEIAVKSARLKNLESSLQTSKIFIDYTSSFYHNRYIPQRSTTTDTYHNSYIPQQSTASLLLQKTTQQPPINSSPLPKHFHNRILSPQPLTTTSSININLSPEQNP